MNWFPLTEALVFIAEMFRVDFSHLIVKGPLLGLFDSHIEGCFSSLLYLSIA